MKYVFDTISFILNFNGADFLKTPVLVAWLNALLAPVKSFHSSLYMGYYNSLIRRARYNGQTIVLTALLNRELDTAGVFIQNMFVENNHFIVFRNSAESTAIYPVWSALVEDGVKPRNSYSISGDNFIVHVPSSVSVDKARALIDRYKLYSTQYSIVVY